MFTVLVFLLSVQQVYLALNIQADERRGGYNETITKLLQFSIPFENDGPYLCCLVNIIARAFCVTQDLKLS
jgi:hypothetical protein